jgi:large repetitive protein
MNLTNIQLHTLLPDGTERIVRLVNMASPMDGANLLNAPLVFKVEGGAKYKLINIETGAHQKGQSLVRHNKDLKVFIEDVLAIELQDYFVASLTPAENAATYQLENASCNEVQVTSNYPLETFQIPESLTWTENDSALDCKVALFNPGSAVGLIPSATPVLSTSFGFGQIAATVIGIPVLLGGTGGSGSTPPPPTPTPPTPGPIDTTSPSLVITTNASSAKADETILITFTFSEDIGDSFNWDGTSGDIVVTGGTLSALSGSGLVRTAIFTPTPNQTSSNAGISVKPGSYQDASGNLGLGTYSPSLSVDTTLPKLISTEITSAKDGLASLSNANIQWLNSGDTLFASATFSEAIFLDQTNGSPTLQLLVGDQTVFATYQSGSGTNTLIFSTTVINGQSDTDGVSIALNALQLNGATVKDIAGNQSLISSSPVISNPNFLIDTTFPEVVVSSNVSTLKINETATVTFTFTEDPGSSFIWNGTEGDLIVSGGTLSAIEGTGLTRSAIFTPAASQLNRSARSSDTSASITVSSASYSDAAGNTGSAGSSPSITIDTRAPTVAIASNVATLKVGETATITFTFSEDPGTSFVWNGTAGDLTVSGGTLGAISGTGLTRTAVFTPTANLSSGSASITVSSASYSDAAGNTGAAGTSPSITIDTLSPTVSITSNVAALKVGETATITFTFSEDPGTSFAWNGTAGDLTISGGTLGVISGTGLTRTAAFTPTANLSSGSASITVTSASYSDAAGNLGSDGTSPSITIDTLAPTVTITSDMPTLKVGETATITFTFSEDPGTSFVWNGTDGDLTISGGTLSAISGTGLSRTGTFTPNANQSSGSASITVTSVSYSDKAGNTGAAGTSSSIKIDTLAPTVAITSNVATLKVGETATITFTFSEDPGTSFAWNGTADDLTISGGSLGTISGSGLTRTATFTPTANQNSGSASITVTSASYSDAAGNTGSAGLSPFITIDTLAPTVAITSNVTALKVGETATITFTFSEDPGTSFVWNGTTGDLTVSGGTLSAISGTGLTRTGTFTPTANLSSGSGGITVTSASYSDAAGNTGSAGTSPSITIDTLAPTVSITSDMTTLKVGETATITFTFSEDPGTSFTWNGTAGDLTISGGTLSAISGTGLTRSAVFTPTANLSSGSASITVTSASYSDVAGNTGSAGTSPSISIDTAAPTVVITSDVAALKIGETATITFTFTEDPSTSFAWNGTAGDLTVSGGTLGAISGTGLTRTAVFTPTANLSSGSASITITSSSYSDAAGNTGSAGSSPSISIDTLAPTVTITSNVAALKAGQTAVITFIFSEDPGTSFVWNGTAGDLTVLGGSLGAISGTGLSRSAIFTPTTDVSIGTASISISPASYTDAAGNTGTGGSSPSIVINTLGPIVSITSNVATLKSGETATITFTFSDDPGLSFEWNGTAGDLTVSGGTVSAISGTGLTRTAVFTPTANLSSGSASITVTSASYTDAAGNSGSAGASPTIKIDTLAPTVTITSDMATLKIGETATFSFTFSEDPGTSFAWNGTAGDLTISGGTLGAISGTGLTRTATFTPSANLSSGSATITVTSASYSDAAGNTGSAGASSSITIDTLAPSVAITSNVATLKVGETATITFTFSEDPGTSFAWNGTAGDLTVSGGTLGAISGTGLTRTGTFTPTANLSSGSASITVKSATYADAAGNIGSAGSSPSITIDTVAPTVTITSNVSALKVGETATITFTFSEDPVTSFTWNGSAGDLLVTGGTLSAISGKGLTRTATFTPTANLSSGSASITVTSASYSDAAGNTGSAGTSPSVTIDTLAPTVTVTSNVSALKAGETATITFTFSEDPGTSFVWDGTAGDIAVSGGTLGAISGTGLTRTGTFTPTANLASGSASITVTSASYSDAAGNTGSAGTSPSINIDTVAPTVSITSNVAALKAGETATITFTFSEDPSTSFAWNGTAGDLHVSGGTLSAISGTGLTRNAVFTPTANLSTGSASITITSASYADSAGNTGAAGTSPSITIDTVAPTVAITSNVPALKVGETATITFTFSEDPGTSFAWNGTAGDLTISGGTLSSISGTGLTRTAVFTPTASQNSGTASITVTSASYSDDSGNTGSAGTSPSITIDTLAPTVTITSDLATLKVGETAAITFTFSEDPGISFAWNGTVGDLTISGGTLGAISGTGLTRTAVFTPTANLSSGSASITVTSASYADSAGNTGASGTSPSITIDTVAPTVAITSDMPTLKVGETAAITFTFSEDPGTSFAWNGTAGDLTVSGGTLSAISGTGLTRTAVFTPTANLSSGSASITVTSASYADSAGNTGAAGTSPSITIDTVAPTVAITSNVAALKIGETATITFTFSEDPGTSFAWNETAGDLTVSGGTLGAISGTGLSRTGTFTPTASLSSGSASITVTSASYSDTAGNTGSSGTSPSITIDTLAPTVAITSNVATLKVGETATITFTFSEDPGTSFAWNGTAGDLTISGGTLSSISGTGLTRTAVFSPTANLSSGSASITVTSASYSDAAGNTGAAGTSPSITIDTVAPTVAITSNVATLKVGETATITFTFSEDPGTSFAWNGTAGDLTISGGTLGAISGTGLSRTGTFTPTASLSSGSASITVSSASYSDAAGNTGSAGTSPSITIDTLAPNVAITSNVTTLKVGETATITFTFSEDPGTSFAWNGTTGDLTVSDGTLGAISGTGLTRNAVFTPTANLSSGSASIRVTSASYADAAGNTGAAGTSPSITIDTLAPTVAITSNVTTLKVGETATITFTFSEDPGTSFTWNGTAGDLTVSGGTLGAISGSGLTRTAVFTPTANQNSSSASITVTSASYSDAAGNPGSAGLSTSITIDTLAPTVTITSNVAALKVGQTATITFTFSEDPGTSFTWNGTAGDLTISNGTLSAISGTGLTRTATFTPTANLSSGSASITVTSSSYSDTAGNTGSAGTSPSIIIDTLAPTVAITSNVTTLKVGETATITFTFSEDPGTSFAWNGTAGDLTVSGGTLGAISGTGLTRTATFTPIANQNSSSASITVTSASYADSAGNTGSAGNTPSLNFDTLNPTISSMYISGASGIISNTLNAGDVVQITANFSESITVNATGAKPRLLLNIGGVSKYADYLSGSGTSDLVFGYTIAAGDTDANGVSYAANALQLNGGTIKDSTGNNATLTAIARSDNAAYKVDTTSPSVAITSNVSTVGMGQTANITFTFSEDPGSSFTTDDVLVTQGTLSAITGSGLTRTAVFTPFADTSLTAASITVPAASFTDTAGNDGLAGTSPSLSVNTFKNAIYLDDIANNIGGYVIESPNANANFGFSVSLVGDFNGDGYGDVIVGAPLNKFTETNGTVRTESGAAVIYEGGLNTQNVPAGYSGTGQVNGRYLYNNVNQGWLGYSVAGVGDMNNDGYADVLIGMPQDPDTQNLAGAYLVYGKPNDTIGSLAEYQKDITKLGSGSGLSITYPAGSGPTYRSSAGYSVSSAGDVNGDGWADMMISAVYQIVPGLGGYTGVTYVIYGSAALTSSQSISLTNVGTSVAGFVISGWQAGEKSGTSVSSAGDFNGDGKADLLVGAHLNSTGGTYAGATYVILGKSDNTAVDLANINNNSGGFVILGENSNDFSGISVSSGGDINGDGLGDLIVGAMIKDETSTTHPGKTYVVFGRTTANATIDLGQLGAGGFTIVSTDAKDSSGFNVSSAGDINGDGLADIILGARQRTESGVLRVGQSYVVYGKANTTQINLTDVANNQGGFAIIGQGTADLTGYAVSAAGDVNGDGLADLMVGAYGYDAASSLVVETGRTYIIFGSKGGPFAAGTKVDNAGTSANDTLTSTGSQTLVGGSFSAGTGNDTFIANGADVLLGGMGQDIFTVNSSMITALQNKFGAGGNTNQLAKIDGGAGIDTIRMGGTGGLNLDFSLISNTAVGNIEGASRINSIERIDLRTDTAANQITLRVADVLDMAGSNWANLSALNTLGAGGWQNWTGSLFSASGVKYHQVAIEGTSADRVNTSGWTLQAGTVKDANSIIYDVYIAANNAPAMMLVEQNITRFSVP